MQTEWGRDERTGRPSSLPIYTLTLLAFAMATVIGVSCVRYIRVWTPLQRHYLPAYLGGQIAGTFRANGWYTLLQVVTQKGSRVALDSDVMPAMSEGGQLNQAIRYAMQDSGQIAYGEYGMKVLVARQEITAADRQWAAQYESGNVVRYAKGSKTVGTEAGDYARVEGIDEKQNLVIVGRANGQRVSYDPRRLQGVTLYREMEREFSEGDRVQFTAPDREQRIANRELGTIEKIDASGDFRIRLDSGRAVAFNIRENPHLDHGYAVTSHSSQGQTADRVLINVDTKAGEKLVNRRMAYVAVSQGRYDAQIYTNDKTQLAEGLDRNVRTDQR